MGCPIARELLKKYHQASLASREACDVARSGMRPSDPGFSAARDLQSIANQALLAAQQAYWQHVRSHGCRTSAKPQAQQEMETRLRKDMLQAREVFDQAVEKYDHLKSLAQDIGHSPDGGIVFAQAKEVQFRAYTVYLQALRRYADYVLLGDLTEDPQAHPAKNSKPN